MKLRNKKTGRIYEPPIHSLCGKDYETLTEICEDWEDYEEGEKEYYTLNSSGQIWTTECFNEGSIKDMKSIGNYFETEEEAEKAMEKLKAWKRLKDKGAKFYGWRRNHTGSYDLLVRWEDRIPRSYEVKKDLDICFGGEE